MSLDETLAFYDDRWERTKPPTLRIVKDRYNEQNYKDTGREYVRNFYEQNQPFEDGRTLGIEKQVEIRLSEELLLIGYIDRLVDHGSGRYEIIDYKTNRDLPALSDLETNWQLPLYQMGLIQMFPDLKEVTCTWYFLAHGKALSLRKSAEDLGAIQASVRSLVAQIEATTEFETRTSALCNWCDYQAICPAQKHLLMVEKLPVEEFLKEDGVKLVDEFLRVEQAYNEAKVKLDELRQRIFDYGIQQNVSLLRGSSQRIRIWSKKDAVKLVGKDENPSAPPAIRKILEKHGLWNQFATLSSWELGKAIEAGSLPPAVMQELAPYIKKTHVWRLYPGK